MSVEGECGYCGMWGILVRHRRKPKCGKVKEHCTGCCLHIHMTACCQHGHPWFCSIRKVKYLRGKS